VTFALSSWQKLSTRPLWLNQQQQQTMRPICIALNHYKSSDAEEWLSEPALFQSRQELVRWHLAHNITRTNWKHALVSFELCLQLNYPRLFIPILARRELIRSRRHHNKPS